MDKKNSRSAEVHERADKGVGPDVKNKGKMGGKKLTERLDLTREMLREGKRDLKKMEEMVSADGYQIEELDRDELITLLEDKEIDTGRYLSEQSLHVLLAARCAGSYGCG